MFGSGFGGMLDGLRCRESEWLRARRAWLVREQRRLHVEELAVLRVLDERGQVDDRLADRDKVSVREVRAKRRTAQALEDLPCVADAAARGDLSAAQLEELAKLADPAVPGDDERWAAEGPSWSPDDLADERRRRKAPTVADAAARRAARSLRWWWRQDTGMLDGRFSLPDVDGAAFETVVERLAEQMRPAKGGEWETRERRGADALMTLVHAFAERREGPATGTAGPLFVVHVPMHGPATVAGVPLPDETVERLRANAKIETVLDDDDEQPITVGRCEAVLSEKTKRMVRQRDGKCRWPGCDRRIGLEVHHLQPRSWGGPDEIWNLASVCTVHHAQLAPQGDLLLVGNPNHPNGLHLTHRDHRDRPGDDHHARAGPEAA